MIGFLKFFCGCRETVVTMQLCWSFAEINCIIIDRQVLKPEFNRKNKIAVKVGAWLFGETNYLILGEPSLNKLKIYNIIVP